MHLLLILRIVSLLLLGLFTTVRCLQESTIREDLSEGESSSVDEGLVLMGTSSHPVPRPGKVHLNFTWGGRADPDSMHRCSFVLKTVLSDPHGEIIDKPLVADHDGLNENEKMVLQYIKRIGAKVKRHSNRFITAGAPIHVWERAFKTEFYRISSDTGGHELLRCKQYHLPKYMADIIHAVMNTVQIPAMIMKRNKEPRTKDVTL